MTVFETLYRISLASPIVWRLTRMVSGAFSAIGPDGQDAVGGAAGLTRLRPEDFLGSRVLDFLYWISIGMSAQTALWVVCGFAALLLNWFALSAVARLASRVSIKPLTARRSTTLETQQSGSAQPCQ